MESQLCLWIEYSHGIRLKRAPPKNGLLSNDDHNSNAEQCIVLWMSFTTCKQLVWQLHRSPTNNLLQGAQREVPTLQVDH